MDVCQDHDIGLLLSVRDCLQKMCIGKSDTRLAHHTQLPQKNSSPRKPVSSTEYLHSLRNEILKYAYLLEDHTLICLALSLPQSIDSLARHVLSLGNVSYNDKSSVRLALSLF